MMATLWVRVISASVEEAGNIEYSSSFTCIKEPCAVQVTSRVGSMSHRTRKQPTPSPYWDEKFMFSVNNTSDDLVLELHRTQLLFRTKILGIATIPLYSIRHSSKDSEGYWSFLFMENAAGDLVPTQHQLHLDAHFDLPKDLPADLLEALDRKLSRLDEVLEKEIEVLEIQQQRLITGELSPPSTHPVSYSYPPSSSSTTPSPSTLRLKSCTPPIITVTSPKTASLISAGTNSSPAHHASSRPINRSPEHARRHRRKSPFSEQEASIAMSETKTARDRWKEILHSPAFKETLTTMKAQRDGKDQGIFRMAQIVDQLKQQKTEENIKSFISVNADFLTRSHSVIKSKRKSFKGGQFMDEDLRIHVYKRAVEALVYPASDPDSHNFEKWTAHKPTNCSECNSLLWGLARQGVKCTKCGKVCHERCSTIARQKCFQIHDQHSSTLDLYLAAISDKMYRTITNNAAMFETLREAFSVAQNENQVITEEIKRKILDLAQDFSAIVKVKVIAAQGLNITKERGVYVSVAVGHSKKRTKTVKGDGLPYWNEEFAFSCFNYHEPIQIRVWNERDTALAKMAQRLTKEGDTFLGEKVIEVRRVGAPRDVWHKLEKRTTGSQVSGSVNVNLSARVDNDLILAPFHDQYMRLHEQMFIYAHLKNQFPLMQICTDTEKDDDNKTKFLPKVSQDIIEEFALRYAVEPIFRMMVHHQLLVKYHHCLNGALKVMDNLLRSLRYQMFTVVAADNAVRAVGATRLMEEHFDSSNFGRDNFAALLDKLLSSLRLDLQQYRELYPANDDTKLRDLVDTCQMMGTVLEFQQQAMGILTTGKLSDMIVDSMKECLKNTFELIIPNCVPKCFTGEGHPALVETDTPFEFFTQLMEQIQSAVNDDRVVYAPLISRFCGDNFGDISAVEMWKMFSTTIINLFDDPANLELFPPNAYIHLLYAVKNFYKFLLADVPKRSPVIPPYHQWFIPCVRHWLQEYQQGALAFVSNAWEDDKTNDKFAPHQNQPYSNSVYQMFFFLNKGYELLQSLHTPDGGVPMDDEAKHVHFRDFSEVVCSVVGQYVDKVSVHLPESVEDLDQACMLLNNLHALRVHTQGLFEDMGGEDNIGSAASESLSDFQANVLAKELLSWCVFVARSLTTEILHAVGMLQSELLRLKGHPGVDKNEVRAIAGPLMDMLTKRARIFAGKCESVVLQKVIKEVWYVVLESLHRMLLPMLQWDKEGVQAVSADFPAHNYTSRQCTALETMLEILKDFFAEGGQVTIKMATLDRGVNQLKGIIYLYRQTTEMLISEYVVDSNASCQATDASCGEVSLEINAYHHPATGELEGTIRVVSATNLNPIQGGVRNMKPFIELNLVVPQAAPAVHKRKFVTSNKSGTASPNFNQSFQFILNAWEERCQLHVTAKHHYKSFGLGSDKVIGVAVVPLSTVVKEANVTLGLSPSLHSSDQGQALLNVLSVRTNDEHAKEFVLLKRQHRDVKHHEEL